MVLSKVYIAAPLHLKSFSSDVMATEVPEPFMNPRHPDAIPPIDPRDPRIFNPTGQFGPESYIDTGAHSPAKYPSFKSKQKTTKKQDKGTKKKKLDFPTESKGIMQGGYMTLEGLDKFKKNTALTEVPPVLDAKGEIVQV